MNEGRLPRPSGRDTPRLRVALRLYRRLWVGDRAGMSPLRVSLYTGALNGMLEAMTRQETADYYAGVRKLEGR